MYWRRRAVAAALVVLVALLVAWAVTSGGGKGKPRDDAKAPASGPAHSITPGPSRSGPAITERPGGDGGSDGSGATGGDTRGSSGGGSAGTDGGSGANGTNGGTQGGGSGSGSATGSGSGTGSGVSAARPVPAGSSLPDCAPGSIRLSLKTELSYAPDEKPKFRLYATNTSSTACKADFGPKNAVLTVTEAGGDDEEVWSSEDCPRKAAAVLLEVPAATTVVHTVEWDRAKSAPKCATPPAGKAGPGTYLVEVKAPGEPVERASFVLAKD
ncbi:MULTISPECIES: hypothetical protein [unclassified Streptomyces]|uniref:hypothetical protein n=1 Tax=unclassified Streptomyces TaxID=2593676 RepID=UPI000DAEFD37|nr:MULTISPECIES: hypothetical protein [unclassified Streptomyces]PZT72958.1 hypothetical protein DNK55_28710 [Streptomyces sp. AC1-42T]PZT83740.1 hypothetical protein DNK56_02860 [Streptomyces sp. AC1-42W]